MKKFTLRLIAVALLLIAGAILWVGPAYLLSAPGVATGMGAKLACSARFVSGFSEQQAREDLTSYSPILAKLGIVFGADYASASLLGFSATARYQPGLGCSIEFDGIDGRAGVQVPALTAGEGAWPRGNEPAIQPQAQALLESLMAEDNAAGLHSRALLVVKDGQLVAEAYAEGVTPETKLLGWSMAKSVTAIALGRLHHQSRLDLDQRGLFPQWQADARADITLRHMLTMTDGLAFGEHYQPGEDATNMLFIEPGSADFALTKPAGFEPGSRFNYSSGTANLLAKFLVNQLGGLQATVDFLARELWAPMGISGLVFETDARGVPVGSSYVYASGRDWARFGWLMANGGEINGRRLLDQDFVREAAAPNHSANEKAYGFQFWRNGGDAELRWPDLPANAYGAFGNRQQQVLIVPDQQLVFVRLGWTAGDYPVNGHSARVLRLFAPITD